MSPNVWPLYKGGIRLIDFIKNNPSIIGIIQGFMLISFIKISDEHPYLKRPLIGLVILIFLITSMILLVPNQ